MLKAKRVVFVSHEASYSGAPILLLNLLQLIKEQEWFYFDIIIIRGGPLENVFSKLGRTIVLRYDRPKVSKASIKVLKEYLNYKFRMLQARWRIANADLVFSNTIVNGKSLKRLNWTKKPVVVYVHELESAIQAFNKSKTCTLSLQQAVAVLYPSAAVKENLVKNHNVSTADLHLLHYYFPALTFKPPEAAGNNDVIQLGRATIPITGKFLVAGMGTANLRKGIDLFLEVCDKVTKVNASVQFVWIGDFVEPELADAMNQKIKSLHIQDHFFITGFLPPDALRLQPFQLLALTSREDPYPLVVLEAALLKKPAVVFEEGGGMTEFVTDGGAGFAISGLDATAMADKILSLASDYGMLQKAGDKAFQKALQEHANPHCAQQQLLPMLEKILIRQRKI